MKSLNIFLFALILGSFPRVSSAEQSGFAFSPALFYFSYTTESATRTTTTFSFIDIRVGYQMTSGFYLGGLYTTDSIKTETPTSTTIGSITAYGPQIGYSAGGWYVLGAYHVKSEYQVDETTIYRAGSGYQVDVGYRFANGTWSFAPQMGYRFLEYSEDKNGNSLTNKYKRTDIVPSFTFWFFL
jgi:hypothetical protein